MINSHPLGCLENSDRKVKQFHDIPRIASSHLVNCLSMFECVWFCNVTPDLYSETVMQLTLRQPNGLARMVFTHCKSSSVLNLVYSYKQNQTRFECSPVLSISFEVDVPTGKVGGSLLFEHQRWELPRGVWGHAP